MNKHIILFLSVFFLFTTTLQTVAAEQTNTSPLTTVSTTSVITPIVISQKNINAQTRLLKLKTNADTYINERIASLNTFVTRAKTLKTSGSTQVVGTISNITTSIIPGLTALRNQIDAINDPKQIPTLLPMIKDIFAKYRIYALELPKDHALLYSANITNKTAGFTMLQTKMTAYIAKAQTKGKDTTKVNADKAKFSTDIAKLTSDNINLETILNGLTPSNNPGTDPLASLKTTIIPGIHTDLLAVRTDIATFAADYKNLK